MTRGGPASDRPVLLITGGGRGIGHATAMLAARRGYDVAFSYLSNDQAATAVVVELKALGVQAKAIKADVSTQHGVDTLFDEVLAHWGRLDGLVNNAGILEAQMPLVQMDLARWQRVFQTNVMGVFMCCQRAVQAMSHRNGGSGGAIVNVSSRAAQLGSPNEYVDYAASKGAVNSLTVGLAKEVADQGIRVNAVAPGLIHTDIHANGGEPGRIERLSPLIPMKRGGSALEVAKTLLFLLSDEASYITGSIVDVGGGR